MVTIFTVLRILSLLLMMFWRLTYKIDLFLIVLRAIFQNIMKNGNKNSKMVRVGTIHDSYVKIIMSYFDQNFGRPL